MRRGRRPSSSSQVRHWHWHCNVDISFYSFCGSLIIVLMRAALGDLIFITTSGLVYSVGRYLTENAYDHVVSWSRE